MGVTEGAPRSLSSCSAHPFRLKRSEPQRATRPPCTLSFLSCSVLYVGAFCEATPSPLSYHVAPDVSRIFNSLHTLGAT